jgi:hypothetical protein
MGDKRRRIPALRGKLEHFREKVESGFPSENAPMQYCQSGFCFRLKVKSL